MNPVEELRNLSESLHLNASCQDWGIENADPNRLREFIDFCTSQNLTAFQEYQMVELVLASANDAMDLGTFSGAEAGELAEFLSKDWNGLAHHLRYWSSFNDDGEFPIGRFLRELAVPA